MSQDWFVLISKWNREGMGDAITLPFLVGALAHKARRLSCGEGDIRSVLNEIIETPVEGYFVLAWWCSDIRAPALRIMPSNQVRYHRTDLSMSDTSGEQTSLVLAKNLNVMLSGKGDRDFLLKLLVEDAIQPVSQGQFSRNRSVENHAEFEYGALLPGEIAFIERTIMCQK